MIKMAQEVNEIKRGERERIESVFETDFTSGAWLDYFENKACVDVRRRQEWEYIHNKTAGQRINRIIINNNISERNRTRQE